MTETEGKMEPRRARTPYQPGWTMQREWQRRLAWTARVLPAVSGRGRDGPVRVFTGIQKLKGASDETAERTGGPPSTARLNSHGTA
jgi:hypothetical protein